MKKTVFSLLIALTIGLSGFSQTNKPNQPDSAWSPASDSTEFIQIRDINLVMADISKENYLTPLEFGKVKQILQEIVNRAIERKRLGKKTGN